VELPVVIHSREAAADTMEIMKKYAQGIPGVIHCYSYSPDMALEYVKMGYFIGVGGVVTFKNARKLVETVEAVPLEQIVVETDCPYLSPEPHRGSRNSSRNLPYVIEKIAALKGVSPQQVEEITWDNACRLYGRNVSWQP
jgi:TatD DNase family protein